MYYLSRLISSQKNREFVKSDYDSIHKIRLTNETVYGKPVVLQELDKMCAVVIRLRKNNSIGDSKDILISMLEELLSNKDKEEKKQNLIIKYGMKMTTQMERRLNIMCNYSDIVEELEEEVDVIEKIYETAKKYAPEYDVEEILKGSNDKVSSGLLK